MTLAIHTARLRAFLTRLETTRIGGIGAGTAVAGAVTLLAQGFVRSAITTVIAPHLGAGAAAAANALLDSAVSGASTTLVPAIALAYVGRGPLGSVADNSPILSTEGTAAPIAAPVQVANPVASNGRPRLAPTTVPDPTAGLQAGKEQVATVPPTTTTQQITGGLADAIVNDFEANKDGVTAAITAVEGGLDAAIVNTLKKTKPSGLLGAAWGFIEPNLETYVANLIAKYGAGPVAYAFLDKELHYWAAGLGG
jgi:hypothetical protein